MELPSDRHVLDHDPRWRRLLEHPITCAGCGQTHVGLFHLSGWAPDQWEGPEDVAPNGALDLTGNFLSEDFCVLDGQHFFVRAILELPIVGGGGERFGFGVWTTLARPNFERYVATFDSGDQGNLGPWFGWFSTHLLDYPETVNLRCSVHPRRERSRPLIELEQARHPLALEQSEGITLDRVLDIYALNGHDLRPGLEV